MTDGLPSSTIGGITLHPDGHLWVGTSDGLSKFDGVAFQNLSSSSLPRSGIKYMCTGPDGQIYIGTERQGLFILRGDLGLWFGRRQGMKSIDINMVLPVGPDEAWIATKGGYLYHYLRNAIAETEGTTLHGDSIYGLARTHDGKLWIGTANGLFFMDASGLRRYHAGRPLPGSGISDLAVTSDGSLYAATEMGLYQIFSDGWKSWTIKDGLPKNFVSILAAGQENQLWIGTSYGLAELENGRLHRVAATNCSILSLLPERDNGVWAGCVDTGGLLHVRPSLISTFPALGTPVGPAVRSVVEDREENVWLASDGLIRITSGHAKHYARKDGLPSDVVYGLSVAPDNSVWVATQDGFAQMAHDHLKSFRTLPSGHDDVVLAVTEDHQRRVWVATSHGLYRRAPGLATFDAIPNIAGLVWSVRESRNGEVWVTTQRAGLYRFSEKGVEHFTKSCGLSDDNVLNSLETADGSVWVLTAGGVNRIRNGVCRQLLDTAWQGRGVTNAMVDDGQGFLWFKGRAVFALKIDEANRALDNGNGTVRPLYFGASDGFDERIQNSPATNALFRLSSGKLLLAMTTGVGEIDPEIVRRPAQPLHALVTSITSDSGEHAPETAVTLKADDRRLQFAYCASSLHDGTSLEYRYRLEPFDKEWRNGDARRTAVYTALPPTNYQFQVSARRPFGSWSEPSLPLDVSVMPHFYQTWWWYTLLVLSTVAILFSFYQYKLIAVRRHYFELMSERSKERTRIARELHDTLSQGMVGIHMQITAAQVLIEEDPESASAQMERIGSIARRISVETRQAISALRAQVGEESILAAQLMNIAVKHSHISPIPLRTDFTPHLPAVDAETSYEIARIIEEALTNVRLHSGATEAVLRAGSDSHELWVEVRDNGQGYDTAETVNGSLGHFGVLGMHERAAQIGASVVITSVLAAGTQVELKRPLHVRTRRRSTCLNVWKRKND